MYEIGVEWQSKLLVRKSSADLMLQSFFHKVDLKILIGFTLRLILINVNLPKIEFYDCKTFQSKLNLIRTPYRYCDIQKNQMIEIR